MQVPCTPPYCAEGGEREAEAAVRKQAVAARGPTDYRLMNTAQDYCTQLIDSVRSSQRLGPILLAVTIGAGTGMAAILFRNLIEFMNWLFFSVFGESVRGFTGVFYVVPVLALGGLIVGLITKYFAPETKGHGVPEVMLAVAHHGGRIRPRVTLFKAIAAAITIGSGGSSGREGPIVQIGSALGSTLGQLFRLPDRRVTLSVACGAAGGIAATFNAPIAGVMFALEVILARFTAMSFGLVVLSSTTATVVMRSLLADGAAPAFRVVSEHGLTSLWEVPFFAVLGIACALVGQVYIRSLYAVEDVADRLKAPDIVKPALGGALVGLVGIQLPQVFATGYQPMEQALNSQMTLALLLVLCVAKIAATALTVGSGGSGGVFAPALFIGAMFGGAFGSALNTWFPATVVSAPGAYALVGMAALFAGVAHAPITAILILYEMTQDYRIILPLMTASVLSTFVSQWISRESIYTIKLRRRGITIGVAQDINLMDAITVKEAMTVDFSSVRPDLPLTALIMKLANDRETGYPVINSDGKLVGMVAQSDVEHALIDRNPDRLTVWDICTRNVVVCRPEQTLSTALAQFGARNIGRMPVIDPDAPGRVIGVLRRSGVIGAYAKAHERSAELLGRVDAIRAVSEDSEPVLRREIVTAGAPLDGILVRDAGFPPDSTLAAVQRGDRTIMPRGTTRILAGDILAVLSTRSRSRDVRDWLRERC